MNRAVFFDPPDAKDANGNPFVLWMTHGNSEPAFEKRLDGASVDTLRVREYTAQKAGYTRIRFSAYRGDVLVTDEVVSG